MENLKGHRVSITFSKEVLELEKKYQKLPDAQQRSELIRELYFEYLNEKLTEEDKKK